MPVVCLQATSDAKLQLLSAAAELLVSVSSAQEDPDTCARALIIGALLLDLLQTSR